MKAALPGAVVLLASGLWLAWPWIVPLVSPVPPSTAGSDLVVVLDGGPGRFAAADRISHAPPQPTPELLQGFDTATQITALAHWLRHQPSPRSTRVWIATDPDHTARAVVLARIALGSQGIRVGPADWPTPSPAERRKLFRDDLRLSLWRATGSTGAWLAPEVAALTGMPTLWPLVGALFSFLLWNWSPAKVFMGDVGSTFLGAVFACVVLQQASFTAALGLLLVATPLLADACICVLRRLLAGQQVFQAHRLHLFQRLHQAGWSHARVASSYIAATGVLAIALLVGGWLWVLGLAGVVLIIGLWLDQRVAPAFVVASRS